MIFLGPLYQYAEAKLAGHINHWPLVQLIIYSLDKTLFYLLIALVLRWAYLRLRHQRPRLRGEVRWVLFTGYLLMLLMLTVFRNHYLPWQWTLHLDRPVSDINLTPLVNTFKLRFGSPVDLWYQSLGNVVWFLPFGFMLPTQCRRRIGAAGVLWRAALLSVVIESLQFLLYTGVADIDDVLFNALGGLIGYFLYRFLFGRPKR
ncbi:VanZ family protein [Lacticaseibacillus jixianensis]|uniref:VanZ family protein n=1 Tax=Lacticaseibacillus jixianensis TaxID=2486012 RepID=A0ABW4BE38_9LACO|nr:VanZ family protein [Lacticaseibacillus jixianensis]